MIVCGIIQSPKKNEDHLIIHQISGEVQSRDSIIDAQIRLTENGVRIERNGIRGWRGRGKSQREIYVQTTTAGRDSLGRPVTLGIYLKSENGESAGISVAAVNDLLKKFSLEMSEGSVVDLVAFIEHCSGGRGIWSRALCVLFAFVVCALIAIVLILLTRGE